MSRSWIGAGFLAVLLTVSAAVTWAMDRIHGPIGEDLDRAAVSALAGDWDTADICFRRAQGAWDRWDHFRSCFADHTPVEDIGAGLKALEIYRLDREETDFAAKAKELAVKTAAVGKAHGLSWWNIL